VLSLMTRIPSPSRWAISSDAFDGDACFATFADARAAASGGQLLITGATRAPLNEHTELEDLGEPRLKDFPRPERLNMAGL
jgi:hypothetical protein